MREKERKRKNERTRSIPVEWMRDDRMRQLLDSVTGIIRDHDASQGRHRCYVVRFIGGSRCVSAMGSK